MSVWVIEGLTHVGRGRREWHGPLLTMSQRPAVYLSRAAARRAIYGEYRISRYVRAGQAGTQERV